MPPLCVGARWRLTPGLILGVVGLLGVATGYVAHRTDIEKRPHGQLVPHVDAEGDQDPGITLYERPEDDNEELMIVPMHSVPLKNFSAMLEGVQTYHDMIRIFYRGNLTNDEIDEMLASQNGAIANNNRGRTRIAHVMAMDSNNQFDFAGRSSSLILQRDSPIPSVLPPRTVQQSPHRVPNPQHSLRHHRPTEHRKMNKRHRLRKADRKNHRKRHRKPSRKPTKNRKDKKDRGKRKRKRDRKRKRKERERKRKERKRNEREKKRRERGRRRRKKGKKRMEKMTKPENNTQAVHGATHHLLEVKNRTMCRLPVPVLVRMSEHMGNNKLYMPECTVIYKCDDKAGCCQADEKCSAKHKNKISRYFWMYETSPNEEIKLSPDYTKKVIFENHTECECRPVERLPPCKLSRCPLPFRPRITDNGSCVCNCTPDKTCQEIQRGEKSLSEKGLSCIKEKRCLYPECLVGKFSVRNGTCPVPHDPLFPTGQGGEGSGIHGSNDAVIHQDTATVAPLRGRQANIG